MLKTSGMLATKLQHLKSLPGLIKKRRTLQAERVELDQRAAQLQIVLKGSSAAGESDSESDSESTGPLCLRVISPRAHLRACALTHGYPGALAQAAARTYNTARHGRSRSYTRAHRRAHPHARTRSRARSTRVTTCARVCSHEYAYTRAHIPHACTHARGSCALVLT
jgi:hypothetical protein